MGSQTQFDTHRRWLLRGAAAAAALAPFSALAAAGDLDPIRKAVLVDQAAFAGKFVFGPLSILVLALGFVLMGKGNWSYSSFWVIAGLIIWATSAVTGFLYFKPQTESLDVLIRDRGVEDADVQERIGRILLVARIDIALLLLAVVDMAAKPFFP